MYMFEINAYTHTYTHMMSGLEGPAVLQVFLCMIFLPLYIFVIVVIYKNRKVHFQNVFYYFLFTLSIVDIYTISVKLYSGVCAIANTYIFGRFVDLYFVTPWYLGAFPASMSLQIFIGANRFCAIVFFTKVDQIFWKKSVKVDV